MVDNEVVQAWRSAWCAWHQMIAETPEDQLEKHAKLDQSLREILEDSDRNDLQEKLYQLVYNVCTWKQDTA